MAFVHSRSKMPQKTTDAQRAAKRKRQQKIKKRTTSLEKKITQLSKATGLWTVFLSYDPVKNTHLTLISTPRRSWPPSETYLLQDAVNEISTWPKENGIVQNAESNDGFEVDEDVENESSNNSLLVNLQAQSSEPNAEAQVANLDAYEQREERQATIPCRSVPLVHFVDSNSFNNQKYSDATVYIGKSKTPLRVHRLVLGRTSSYLDNVFNSKLQVYFENNPHAHWRVFQYMYTGDYSEEAIGAIGTEDDDLEEVKHLEVYKIAHLFHIDDLMRLSWDKFERQSKQRWGVDFFAGCIREVYTTSPRASSARKTIVDMMVSYKEELFEWKSSRELAGEIGDFANDLISALRPLD